MAVACLGWTHEAWESGVPSALPAHTLRLAHGQVSFEVSPNHGTGQSAGPPPLPTRPSGGASRTAPGARERESLQESQRESQQGWPGYASFDDLGDASFREAAAPGTSSSLWSRQGQARTLNNNKCSILWSRGFSEAAASIVALLVCRMHCLHVSTRQRSVLATLSPTHAVAALRASDFDAVVM